MEQTLEDRLAALEQRVAIQDSYFRVVRWLIGILGPIAGVIIGRLIP